MSNVSVESLPNCRVKLRIKASKEQTNAAYDSALKSINKSVSFPGFRKGKAPRKLIEQRYAKDLDKEWRRTLLHQAINEAVRSVDQKPIKQDLDRASLNKISLEDGAEIEVEYETEPLSPELDLKGFKLEPVSLRDVTDEDVEKSLHKLQAYHAHYQNVTDRPVELGDSVALEVIRLGDKEMTLCKGRRFEVLPGEMPKWMLDIVVGAKIDEPVEGVSAKDASLDDSDVEETDLFTPATYRLIVKKIAKADLPAFDETFIKKFGVDSFDELKKRVRQNLEHEAKEFVKAQKREQLQEWLIKNYPIDIPDTLKNYEGEIFLRNQLIDLSKQGISEEWVKEHFDELKNTANEIALNRLSLIYILRATSKKSGIRVSEDELNREMIYEEVLRPSKDRITVEEMQKEEKQARLYLTLLTEKVLDDLISSL